MGRGSRDGRSREGGEEKEIKKGIKAYYAHVPTPHEPSKHYEQQTSAKTIKKRSDQIPGTFCGRTHSSHCHVEGKGKG